MLVVLGVDGRVSNSSETKGNVLVDNFLDDANIDSSVTLGDRVVEALESEELVLVSHLNLGLLVTDLATLSFELDEFFVVTHAGLLSVGKSLEE